MGVIGIVLVIISLGLLVPRCDATRMEACAKMCGVGNGRIGPNDGSSCTCIVPGKAP